MYLKHGGRSPRNETRSLVEKTEAHVIVGLLLLFLLLLLSGSVTASGSTGTGNRSGGGVGVRVGDTVLELLNLGPADLGRDSDSENLLVAVDKVVHDSRKGGEAGGQREGSDSLDSAAESLKELLLLDVENIGTEGLTLLVDLGDGHTVGEGRDVEHVQQGSLGGTDLSAGLNELKIGGNFNGTTSNLGGDTESLEERGLTGFHTGVTSRNVDIERSDGTSTSRSSDTVGKDLLLGGLEVAVGEDETNVACDASAIGPRKISMSLYLVNCTNP